MTDSGDSRSSLDRRAQEPMAKQLKRGLVLEGGGAKGAYAFGALLALREEDVEFHAVAGTSVGGLNAVLWATGNLEIGKELWKHLSQDRVYPFRKPRLLFTILVPIVAVLNILGRYFLRGLPLFLDAHIARALRTFHAVFCFCWLLGVIYQFISLNSTGILVLAVTLPFVGLFFVGDSALRRTYVAYWGWIFLFISAISALSEFFVLPDLFSFLLGFVIVGIALVGLVWAVHLARGLTLLHTLPLRSELEGILSKSQISIPTYVTAASAEFVVDPDDYVQITYGAAEVGPMGVVRIRSNYRVFTFPAARPVPHYIRLDILPLSLQVDALLATAALPFGIVPAVKIDGRRLVDGGVVDNSPMYPLVTLSPCDEIFLIALKPPKGTYSEKCDKKRWQHIQRMIDLPKALLQPDATAVRVKNDPPIVCPFRKPPPWPKVVRIAPKEKLGGFWTGTMNFSSEYALKLMEQGYQDAVTVLKAYHDHNSNEFRESPNKTKQYKENKEG